MPADRETLYISYGIFILNLAYLVTCVLKIGSNIGYKNAIFSDFWTGFDFVVIVLTMIAVTLGLFMQILRRVGAGFALFLFFEQLQLLRNVDWTAGGFIGFFGIIVSVCIKNGWNVILADQLNKLYEENEVEEDTDGKDQRQPILSA
jgi:hypothetical protein